MTAAAIDPTTTVRIVAYGTPAPQGSKAYKGHRGGLPVLVESSKKVKPWRSVVAAAAEAYRLTLPGAARRGFPLDEPLAVRMVFTMPKPASAPKRRRTWPTRYPDVSKLARSTEDALTTAGIWADDARVVDYDRLAKVFPGEDPEALDQPGVLIEIRRITDPTGDDRG